MQRAARGRGPLTFAVSFFLRFARNNSSIACRICSRNGMSASSFCQPCPLA